MRSLPRAGRLTAWVLGTLVLASGGQACTSDTGDPCLNPSGGTGPCVSDAQCPDGGYCNFTVTGCPSTDAGAFYTANAGACLPTCGNPTEETRCTVSEDCPPTEWCQDGQCTTVVLCPNGSGFVGGPCPAPCVGEAIPHLSVCGDLACVCPTCP